MKGVCRAPPPAPSCGKEHKRRSEHLKAAAPLGASAVQSRSRCFFQSPRPPARRPPPPVCSRVARRRRLIALSPEEAWREVACGQSREPDVEPLAEAVEGRLGHPERRAQRLPVAGEEPEPVQQQIPPALVQRVTIRRQRVRAAQRGEILAPARRQRAAAWIPGTPGADRRVAPGWPPPRRKPQCRRGSQASGRKQPGLHEPPATRTAAVIAFGRDVRRLPRVPRSWRPRRCALGLTPGFDLASSCHRTRLLAHGRCCVHQPYASAPPVPPADGAPANREAYSRRYSARIASLKRCRMSLSPRRRICYRGSRPGTHPDACGRRGAAPRR